MADGYVRRRTGAIFKSESGKLYIFDADSMSVLRGWPIMRAWKKTRVRHPDWIGFRPSLSWLESELLDAGERMENFRRGVEAGEQLLPLEFRYRKDRTPYASEMSQWYFETTPREIRDLVRPFRKTKWAMMSFLADGGEPAKELLRNSPAIAFMLAHNRIFHAPAVARPRRAVRTWLQLGKTRRDLLRWLGFPPAQSTVRLLDKIPRQDLSISALLKIRECLLQPESAKLLRHQPVVDRALLAFFDPGIRDMLTQKLLGELRTGLLADLTSFRARMSTSEMTELEKERLQRFWMKERQPVWLLMRDTAAMFRQFSPDAPLPRIPSLNTLRRTHDELAERVERKTFRDTVFAPPLPGNDAILPIADYEMLCEEGRRQHNCAASYARNILAGESFLYRVLKPERCTLEIVPRNGKWEIAQLLAAGNRPPREETVCAVRRWLTAMQK